MLIAQLGEHGKSLKNNKKYGRRWLFSSSCFLNPAMRVGKYFVANSFPANRASQKQHVAPDAKSKINKSVFYVLVKELGTKNGS